VAAAVDDLVTAVGERMHAALAAPLLLDGVVLQVTGGIYVALLQSYRRANLVATKPTGYVHCRAERRCTPWSWARAR
jgi:hypothetical protein